jgi:hypothetical protein
METPGVCHQYANCTNTDGNYSCECLRGFTGDGYLNCSGELKSKIEIKRNATKKCRDIQVIMRKR